MLGCDGVFELLKNQDIADFILRGFDEDASLANIVEKLLDQCISPNLMVTQGKGGDNVSAILVKLHGNLGLSTLAGATAAGGAIK